MDFAVSDKFPFIEGNSHDKHLYSGEWPCLPLAGSYRSPRKTKVCVIVMTFWYVFIRTDLNFSNFYSSLGIDHDLHVLYVHMTYVHSFSYVSFFTRSYGQEKSSLYYDPFLTSEFYSMDASLPSFSSSSSTNPPPLYSPSMLNNDGPTWRRIPPGRDMWSSGRSRL